YIVAPDGLEYPLRWCGDGCLLSTEEHVYDLISEWQTPLEFDWDCLPPWCNKYIAKNEDGTWYAYSNEPTQIPWGFYDGELEIEIPKDYQPKNYTGYLVDGLFKNPNLD